MKIETKLKPGDTFWMIHDNKPQEIKVVRVTVNATERENEVSYVCHTQEGVQVGIFKEGDIPLYKSKKELFNSF